MAYTAEELLQYARDKIMASRLSTWSSQNDISYWRGLHHKYDQQLLDAQTQYKDKIQELIRRYKQNLDDMQDLISGAGISIVDFKEDMKSLVAKVLRLAEKYWAVRYEIEGRQKGFFVRKPVGTVYYIDLDNGNDTNDGLSTTTAWLTIEKYTTVTVRTAADIAKVRAGTDQIKTDANIVHDESGNQNNLLSIVGCSSQDDPWGDASDVLPIISFGGTSYYWLIRNCSYWSFRRLAIKNSAAIQNFCAEYPHWVSFEDCEFSGNTYTGSWWGAGLFMTEALAYVKGCNFHSNTKNGLRIREAHVRGEGCVFNRGSGQERGLVLHYNAGAEFKNSSFGQTTAHSVEDVFSDNGSIAHLRNCKYNSLRAGETSPEIAVIFLEDDNQVYGAGRVLWGTQSGTVEKDTGVKTGGANFSFKLSPGTYLGLYRSLTVGQYEDNDTPFMIKLSAGVQKTLTVKVRANTWTAFPTADELYIEWSYYNNASTADRATVKTTAVISQADTWTDFSVTITPQRDGIVYGNVVLKRYESGKVIYCNGEVIVS